mgnify:CR=1 FL=1
MVVTDSMIISTLKDFKSEMKEHLDHCQHWEHAIIDEYEKKLESFNIDVTCKSNNLNLNQFEEHINNLLSKCKKNIFEKEEIEKVYKSRRENINDRINRLKAIIEDTEDNIKYIDKLHKEMIHEKKRFVDLTQDEYCTLNGIKKNDDEMLMYDNDIKSFKIIKKEGNIKGYKK